MSNAVNKEKAKVFETILSSPGMSEKCKVVLQVSRQHIILLGKLIENGLLSEKNELNDELITLLSKDAIEEFKVIHEELLKKADLTDFYQRLNSLW